MVQAIILLRKTAGNTSDPATPDRRRSDDPRIPCAPTKVRIAVEGDFIPVQAQILDVSEFGLGLQLIRPHALCVGMEITIEMSSALITGSIRCCTRKEDAGPFRMGV